MNLDEALGISNFLAIQQTLRKQRIDMKLEEMSIPCVARYTCHSNLPLSRFVQDIKALSEMINYCHLIIFLKILVF